MTDSKPILELGTPSVTACPGGMAGPVYGRLCHSALSALQTFS